MKKILTVLLASAFALSMSATALAADTEINQDNPAPQSGNTDVTLKVVPTYTVTIPEKISLNPNTVGDTTTYENDFNISAEAGVRLLQNEKIQVTIDSDFTMTAGSTELEYTVNGGRTNNAVVAEFTTNTAAQSSTVHFEAPNPEFAGDYIDTVTFNMAIV